jgi:hypothetical protein
MSHSNVLTHSVMSWSPCASVRIWNQRTFLWARLTVCDEISLDYEARRPYWRWDDNSSARGSGDSLLCHTSEKPADSANSAEFNTCEFWLEADGLLQIAPLCLNCLWRKCPFIWIGVFIVPHCRSMTIFKSVTISLGITCARFKKITRFTRKQRTPANVCLPQSFKQRGRESALNSSEYRPNDTKMKKWNSREYLPFCERLSAFDDSDRHAFTSGWNFFAIAGWSWDSHSEVLQCRSIGLRLPERGIEQFLPSGSTIPRLDSALRHFEIFCLVSFLQRDAP